MNLNFDDYFYQLGQVFSLIKNNLMGEKIHENARFVVSELVVRSDEQNTEY